MSVKKTLSLNRERKPSRLQAAVKKVMSLNSVEAADKAAADAEKSSSKRRSYGVKKFFSFSREVNIEPAGATSLKEVDSNKLKAEIIRWAKAVAAYARQVSGRIGRSSSSVHGA